MDTTASNSTRKPPPSPARIRANRLNRSKRKGLTSESRQRLREAALRNKPWEHSAGPRTPAGKAKSAANGLRKQAVPGPSVRQLRGELSDIGGLIERMAALRKTSAKAGGSDKHD